MRLTERQVRAMQCLMRHGLRDALKEFGSRTVSSLERRGLFKRTSAVCGFELTDEGQHWCYENV
jgi:hypothetical protein